MSRPRKGQLPPPDHCPGCRRKTRTPGTSAADFPGTIRRVSVEGHCSTCWDVARKTTLQPIRDPQESVLPLEFSRDWLTSYIADRRRRGVPAGGVHFEGDPEPTNPQKPLQLERLSA